MQVQGHLTLRMVSRKKRRQADRRGSRRERARGRLFWKLLVETRFTCYRPNCAQMPTGPYRAASLRHCSKPDCRSPPLITSTASPKKCCNSWSISFDTPKSWRFDTEIGCFLFSAFFIACFSAECTRPTKSLAKYYQDLQLWPHFFPNRSGIRLFGSANQ